MEYKETEIKGVWIIEPNVFMIAAATSLRLGKQANSKSTLALSTSFKTTNRNPVMASLEAFITKKENSHKPSWCVSLKGASLMLP